MKIIFLPTADEVREAWPRIKPLIDRCVEEAVVGQEFTTADLYQLSLRGVALPFYVEDESGITVAGVLEVNRYPQRTAINVMALAGHGLVASADAVFEEIKAFGRAIGADYIEAACAPAMTRLLTRRLGFVPHYQLLRIILSEVSHEAQAA